MQLGGKLALLTLIICAIACSASSSVGTGHDWGQALKDRYIDSCKKSGGNEAHCSCMQSKMQEHYTVEEISKLGEQLKQDQMPPDFKEFATKANQECAGGTTPAPAPSKSDEPDN